MAKQVVDIYLNDVLLITGKVLYPVNATLEEIIKRIYGIKATFKLK